MEIKRGSTMNSFDAIRETLYRYYHTENIPEARNLDFASRISGNHLSEHNAKKLSSSITHYSGFLENPPSKIDTVSFVANCNKMELPTQTIWVYAHQKTTISGTLISLSDYLFLHSLSIEDVSKIVLQTEVFERT